MPTPNASMRPCLALALLALVLGCESSGVPVAPDSGRTDVPGDVTADSVSMDRQGGDIPVPSDEPQGDGGLSPGGPRITRCPGDSLPALATGVCAVTAGSTALLITGDVLTPGEVFRGGQVLVDPMGVIRCVGCDCSATEGAMGATRVVCPDGVVSPGLINTHDHLTFVQNSPYTVTPERYEHRHDWRRGLRGHTRLSSPGMATTEAMAWGELRFVMGGATSVNGSGGTLGFMRNLDRTSALEGLNQMLVHYQTFPLGDSGGELMATGCGYPEIDTAASITSFEAYAPHIAEGIGTEARNEFLCVREGTNNLVQRQTAVIHGVALLPADIQLMATRGTKLIWSPRSNVTLYGDTARVTEYARLGVPIALGTDWLISGSMNMLRELQCADGLNRNFFDRFFSDEALWFMVTRDAAAAMAMDDAIGVLAPGRVADISIFDGSRRPDHRAIIDGSPADVALVLRGGTVLYGEAPVVLALPGGAMCETLDVCGSPKRACVSSQSAGRTLASLQASNMGRYPLFFCGPPMNEPSCLPARNAMAPNPSVMGSTRYAGMSSAEDTDGDGILNTMDLCPRVFDPVRPMDMGRQADVDMDMLGDACDPCPLNAGSVCRMADPADRDGDGRPNTMDNCPDAPNPDQMDRDMDGSGDLCDACPMAANPAGGPCPASIYAIKSGMFMANSRVSVIGPIVTAVGRNGFYMQTIMGDPGYTGPDFSGMFVFTSTPPMVTVGDRVTVTNGVVTNFFGQTQLAMGTVMTTSRGAALPAPVVVTGADASTEGARALALEGVLIRVEGVTVTNVAPPPGGGEMAPTNEFEVTGGLRVDDGLFLTTPFPVLGEGFASITGILALSRSNSKLNPRSAMDLAGGALNVLPFAPGPYFQRVRSTPGPTVPTALTVVLSRMAMADTSVVLSSSDPGLTVLSPLVIRAGSDRSPVQIVGMIARAEPYTLTAAVMGSMLSQTVQVRVIDGAHAPALLSLVPSGSMVLVGAALRLTLTLDAPAPAGGVDVLLSVDSGGSVPAMVNIPADALTAEAMFTAGAVMATSVLTARLGMVSRTATVMVTTVVSVSGLVINEVDYDQVGEDAAEFVEIFNGGAEAVDLASVAVVSVNGSDSREYSRVRLSGMLPAGGYAVLASAMVVVPAGALRFTLADTLQNGAPDGVLLLNVSTGRALDALSYEGAISAAVITGVTGTINLVEGTALATTVADSNTAAGSLSRVPNGRDTNNASMDWRFSTMSTPGAPNM